MRYRTLYPFLPRKYKFSKPRDTLRRTLELLDQRKAETPVETGVARRGLAQTRSDGASTTVIDLWPVKMQRDFSRLTSIRKQSKTRAKNLRINR